MRVEHYFKTRNAAYRWLKERGYPHSRGHFYGVIDAGGHARDDGRVLKLTAAELGLQALSTANAGYESDQLNHKERKVKADADLAELKADAYRRELDRDWLHASSAWAAVCEIVKQLDACTRQQFELDAASLIASCGGEHSREGEFLVRIGETINAAMNNAADMVVDSGRLQRSDM